MKRSKLFNLSVCTISVLCFMLWLYLILHIIKIPENDLDLISGIEPEIFISYIETAETTDNLPVENVDKSDIEFEEKQEYKSLGEYILTAYCPCVICCDEYSAEHPDNLGTDFIQKTASGTIPQAGRTIGINPRDIPYGTTVLIDSHEYTAEDTGAATIRNKVIDIYFDTHEQALNFGVQSAEIFIKIEE